MSRGITGFQRVRLSLMLAARKLNQSQLSVLVGVSQATVSKWLSGQQSPEPETLHRLGLVLNVSPEWFTRVPLAQTIQGMFRSNASAHVAARAMLQARADLLQDVAHVFSEFIDYPELRIPIRTFSDPGQITRQDIEDAAGECRELWRLGRAAIPDVVLAVEGAGVLVAREDTGVAQIEGVSSWSEALGRPVIVLSADKDNWYRSRFDLSHELGHLILHRYIERRTDVDRYKLLEKQAHYFAGAFLLPAESFALDVRTPVSLDDLLLLKKRWGVSVGAIIMRLRALEIIDADASQALFKRRSARWGMKSEPGDNDRIPEKPRLLKRTIDLLVEEGILRLNGVSEYIGLSQMDIEMLAALPENYLSGSANVVQLSRPRLKVAPDDSVVEQSQVLPFRQA